ncbi:MAG TPA: hypothetical protein DCS30_14005 [Rhizobiales bacterium]|nr:hypothetical protein [Hyphomicrobiales bacterium]
MASYYVNKNTQPNGDHEVHTTGCPHPPESWNRQQLGEHSNCYSAIEEAKKYYYQVNGCYYCCNPCHTQ